MGDRLTWVWRKRGVCSRKVLREFESLSPVRAVVEAPPAPSPYSLPRWDANKHEFKKIHRPIKISFKSFRVKQQ